MKNLIASASPRYLDEVLEPRKEIQCDQFFAKRYFEGAAYRRIKQYYLDHTEYDGYLIIAPDDLIVTNKHYILLKENVKKENYPVISGICNINRTNLKNTMAASWFPKLEYYHMGYLLETDLFPMGEPIMRVEWAGFPFTWIRRDVVENEGVSFKGRPGGRKENEGTAFDLQFAMDLQKLGIPQYVDCRVRMKHLQGEGMDDIKNVGRKGYEPYDYLFLS